jgi:hypothetical protein
MPSEYIARSPSNVASSIAPPPPPELAGGGVVTLSVTDVCGDDPVLSEHDRLYVLVPAAVGITFWVPLVANVPDQLPVALQSVAIDSEDHVIVVEAPKTMEVEPKASVGASGAGNNTTKATALGGDAPRESAHVSE